MQALSELICLAFWKTNQASWRYFSRSANDATACSQTFSTSQCYVCPRRKSGLGLGIANMMADHGAKHLVFLSKSGGSKNEKELQKIRNRGVRADAYKCDITEAHIVASVFHQLKAQGVLSRARFSVPWSQRYDGRNFGNKSWAIRIRIPSLKT